jgi:DNA-binding Xre family transcriptional regulator
LSREKYVFLDIFSIFCYIYSDNANIKELKMGISYKPLFILLAKNSMKKTDLIEKVGISGTTLAKFAKNEHVSGDTIEKLCLYFNCQPCDIFEVVADKSKK